MSQYRKPDEGLIVQAVEVWSEGPEEVPYASDIVDTGPGGPEGGPYAD
jgi:hypothetical protein